MLRSDYLRNALGFHSKDEGKELLKAFEHLRNELAHAQDIITGRWPQLVTFAKKAEDLLATCEALEPKPPANQANSAEAKSRAAD